jgi:hypothetical protein
MVIFPVSLSCFRDVQIGLVLALNARLLAKKMDAFAVFLEEFPMSQILAWTGSGEPRIPKSVVNKLEDYYDTKGMKERIGFDCDTSEE